ncbi:antirestriction protein, partial [Escherichia coli]
MCRLSTGNGIFWPSVCDRNGYAYGCPEFQPNIIHP